MARLIDRLRSLLGQHPHPARERVVVPLDDKSIQRLMHLLCETRDDEMTCEEVYNCLDEYVDCLESRQEFGGLKPLVEHHLGICPDCRDELEALVHAMENAAADDNPN